MSSAATPESRAAIRRGRVTSPSSWTAIGRWAASRGLPRVEGHRRAGRAPLRRAVRLPVPISVSAIYHLLFFVRELRRVRRARSPSCSGCCAASFRNDLADLSSRRRVACRSSASAKGRARHPVRCSPRPRPSAGGNTRLTLVVAFNYGARQEIARAARHLVDRGCAEGKRDAASITERAIGERPRRAGQSRSGSRHPHFGRAASVELPVAAGRLQRTRLRSSVLAGLRPYRAGKRRLPSIVAASGASAASSRSQTG